MKYALLIYINPDASNWNALTEAEQAAISEEYYAIGRQPGTLGGEQLDGTDTATVVRVSDGKTLTTDGPFADTKEYLGGFYLLEAENLDAALETAARIPAARMGGAVEVRPLVVM